MKRTIRFELVPKKINGKLVEENRPIRMRVCYAGNRVDVRVGYSIDISKWNPEEGRVIGGAKNRYKQTSGEINKAITDSENAMESIFTRFEVVEKRVPTPEELKDAYYIAMGRKEPGPEEPEEKPISFFTAFDEFTCTMGKQNDWAPATLTKFGTIKQYFQKFYPTMTFDELNEERLQDFIAKLHKEDLRNTTIAKYMSFTRWFLRWAYHKGYNPTTIQETFKPKFKGVGGNIKEVIYLEWEELIKLYSFQFPESKHSLAAVRDVFCFCCFTGLRYSDVAKLQKDDIKKNTIRIVSKKDVDGLIIELNKYSRAILDKYSDIGLPKGLALPVISNVKMNEYLKIMGKLVGIDEPQKIVYFKGNKRFEEVLPKYALLTTHCGRRTFIVNGLRLGVPSEVIMKWTGHSDYKAMKPYIKIVDKLKAAEMDKFNTYGMEEAPKG